MHNVPTLVPVEQAPKRNWCFPFLHPWTKWKRHATQTFIETRTRKQVGGVVHQHRWCTRCNKLQARKVVVV